MRADQNICQVRWLLLSLCPSTVSGHNTPIHLYKIMLKYLICTRIAHNIHVVDIISDTYQARIVRVKQHEYTRTSRILLSMSTWERVQDCTRFPKISQLREQVYISIPFSLKIMYIKNLNQYDTCEYRCCMTHRDYPKFLWICADDFFILKQATET